MGWLDAGVRRNEAPPGPGIVPFVRIGHSDGGAGVLAETTVAAGFSRRLNHQDWFTLGLGWNKPSRETHGPSLDNEKVLEVSYLWQITANTSLLGDVQYITDPALNSLTSSVWVFGLRMWLAF